MTTATIRINVVSDGTPAGTLITDAETGRPFDLVTRVQWEMDPNRRDGRARLVLWIDEAEIRLTQDAQVLAAPDPPPIAGPRVRAKPEALAARRAELAARGETLPRLPYEEPEPAVSKGAVVVADALTPMLIVDGHDVGATRLLYVRATSDPLYRPEPNGTIHVPHMWEVAYETGAGTLHHIRTNSPVIVRRAEPGTLGLQVQVADR